MKNQFYYLILITLLSVSNFSCYYKIGCDKEKVDINLKEVDSIFVIQRNISTKNLGDIPDINHKPLSKAQIKLFVEEWNDAGCQGLCKYFPTYNIKVKLKNNSIRHFRVSKSTIKENGTCYNLGSSDFMEELLNLKD